jgi:hypothetical protein
MFVNGNGEQPMSRSTKPTKPKTQPTTKKPEKTEPRKYKNAEEQAPDVPHVAYTIPEFCAAHRLSLSMYYKLRTANAGPRESHAGNKNLITFENAAAWLETLGDQPPKVT